MVETDCGKRSAQLRRGYAFAIDHGYDGIVITDGKDEDYTETILQFIDALNDGFDFARVSRYISEGIAENP